MDPRSKINTTNKKGHAKVQASSLSWPKTHDAYEIDVISGWDAFNAARFCRAFVKDTDELVTIRCLNAEVLTSSEERFQMELRAASLSRHLFQHRNLYRPYIHFITDDEPAELWTVGPYTPQGSVRDLLDTTYPAGFDENFATVILFEVASGLMYLHDHGYVHNRLSAESVVITDTHHICLQNFQYCQHIEKDGDMSGTLYDCPSDHSILPWLAPEVVAQGMSGYTTRADIYSLGVLALEILNGDQPFIGLDMPQGIRLSVSPSKLVSKHMKAFISICLNLDPNMRPSIEDVLRHPVFKQVKKHRAMVAKHLPQNTRPVINISAEHLHFGLPTHEPELPTGFYRYAFEQLFSKGFYAYHGGGSRETFFGDGQIRGCVAFNLAQRRDSDQEDFGLSLQQERFVEQDEEDADGDRDDDDDDDDDDHDNDDDVEVYEGNFESTYLTRSADGGIKLSSGDNSDEHNNSKTGHDAINNDLLHQEGAFKSFNTVIYRPDSVSCPIHQLYTGEDFSRIQNILNAGSFQEMQKSNDGSRSSPLKNGCSVVPERKNQSAIDLNQTDSEGETAGLDEDMAFRNEDVAFGSKIVSPTGNVSVQVSCMSNLTEPNTQIRQLAKLNASTLSRLQAPSLTGKPHSGFSSGVEGDDELSENDSRRSHVLTSNLVNHSGAQLRHRRGCRERAHTSSKASDTDRAMHLLFSSKSILLDESFNLTVENDPLCSNWVSTGQDNIHNNCTDTGAGNAKLIADGIGGSDADDEDQRDGEESDRYVSRSPQNDTLSPNMEGVSSSLFLALQSSHVPTDGRVSGIDADVDEDDVGMILPPLRQRHRPQAHYTQKILKQPTESTMEECLNAQTKPIVDAVIVLSDEHGSERELVDSSM